MTQVIGDRFEVERLVGAGGMGEVFRAKDRLGGGPVAVKVLHGSTRDVERFRREGLTLAEIHHPRIVRYVAHGVTTGPHGARPYLAMEWLDGEDLADRLGRAGLTLRETITLARRAAEGLAVLHDRGIVHRDVKPSNLFLPAGEVEQLKLLDLGVVRLLHSTRINTRTGVMIGTPGYMAPEQARGEKEIDARVDVFALGCVIFECLAGKPAFAGDNIAALLAKILLESPPSLRASGVDVPSSLDELVLRMMAKHPPARPANALAVLGELERFATLEDAPAHRPGPATARVLTGSERRLVSVVMASFGDSLRSPDATDETTADTTFETVAASFDPRAVVASYGAEATLLADGTIVATMTGKGGASDQAAHAARCALALRAHLLSARIALATGMATVTGQSCVGDVIDRASSMLLLARDRESVSGDETSHGQSPVFLDDTTAGLLDMRFDVGGDERGLFIRGLRERETESRTLLGKPTPFVGREREMSTLVGVFQECIDESVARPVLVTGQAGAGKSRVTTEFLRRVQEISEVEVLLARGDTLSEGSPFGLIARLLRRTASISGGEPLGVRQQKLRARVGRHVAEADVARVSEFLGEIASVYFPEAQSVQLRAARQDATLMGDQMRRAFCDFVVAEASAMPIIVVLEDLHWGDLPSVNLIDAALRAAGEKPLMVFAVARPEVRESFPSLWDERELQEIRLGPLVRRAGERLVREILGQQVSADECARLLDRAAGNAFFLEELIRAYAEGGSRGSSRLTPGTAPIVDEGPRPRGVASIDEPASGAWALPSTVLAMVQGRLERLDPMARRVLRAASVLGEVFWRGALLALTGGDYKTSEVDDWLAELSRREMVQRRDASRFPSEQEYVFRHGLVRDAAYEMLTAEDRALGHKLAGEWLEKAGEHEAMVLAEHFERGGVQDRASTFFARAAAQALEGNDFAVARMRAERAMLAGATGEELGRLHLLLAEACRWVGENDVALRSARTAMRMLPAGSDGWFSAAAEAVEAVTTLGKTSEVFEIVRAVRELEISGTAMTSARVIATSRIAVKLVLAGAFDESEATLGFVEREASTLIAEDPAARGFVLLARMTHAKWRGGTEEAAVLAREAVTCFETVGDLRNAVVLRNHAGFELVLLGAYDDAERTIREAIVDAERLGLKTLVTECHLHLAQACARLLRREEAKGLVERILADFAVRGDHVGEVRARVYLAGALHLTMEKEVAERELLRALPLVEQSPPYLAPLLGLLAITRADRGDAEGSFDAGNRAMRYLEQLGGTIEGEAIVRLGYAEGLNAKGDREGARKAIAFARERVLSRAAAIRDETWRKGFLERLQEHTRIMARASEWLD